MTRVPATAPQGRVFRAAWEEQASLVRLDSSALRGNPLGDPTERDLAILRPPSGRTEGLPLVLYLPGFTGSGWQEAQREGYLGEGVFRLFFGMMERGECPEAVVVAPDALTRLGGSQYVNSSATGSYATYVSEEIVPWARREFGTSHTGVLVPRN